MAVSSDHLKSPFTGYKIRTRYFWNEGIIQGPVAKALEGDGKVAAEIIRVSGPHGGRVVTWVGERDGEVPVIPDPYDYDKENQALAHWEVTPESPDSDAGAQVQRFRISGIYIYIFRRPLRIEDGKMFIGAAPFDIYQPLAIPANALRQNLVEASKPTYRAAPG